jgi:hypothetical protein
LSGPRAPYSAVDPEDWPAVTAGLIKLHPLKAEEIIDVVRASWSAIFASAIGPKGFRIGPDIQPKPQIMGFFLHELIPLELASRYPRLWSPERTAHDKDLVYLLDDYFSIEIKTSTHRSQVFGNRSYAQVGTKPKKSKAGYFLAVNFEPFPVSRALPDIRQIKFGWLDDSDWIAQKAATGQQARINPVAATRKLVTLFPRS